MMEIEDAIMELPFKNRFVVFAKIKKLTQRIATLEGLLKDIFSEFNYMKNESDNAGLFDAIRKAESETKGE